MKLELIIVTFLCFKWYQNMIKLMNLLGHHQLALTCKRKEIQNSILLTGCDELRSCDLNHTKWK